MTSVKHARSENGFEIKSLHNNSSHKKHEKKAELGMQKHEDHFEKAFQRV